MVLQFKLDIKRIPCETFLYQGDPIRFSLNCFQSPFDKQTVNECRFNEWWNFMVKQENRKLGFEPSRSGDVS